MENIFEVIDKTGRKIYLSRDRWSHIENKHSVTDYEIIKDSQEIRLF